MSTWSQPTRGTNLNRGVTLMSTVMRMPARRVLSDCADSAAVLGQRALRNRNRTNMIHSLWRTNNESVPLRRNPWDEATWKVIRLLRIESHSPGGALVDIEPQCPDSTFILLKSVPELLGIWRAGLSRNHPPTASPYPSRRLMVDLELRSRLERKVDRLMLPLAELMRVIRGTPSIGALLAPEMSVRVVA